MADNEPQNNEPISNDEMNALIAKHRVQIDAVLRLDSQLQQEAFRALGVDPQALMNHYSALQVKAEDIRRRDDVARRSATTVGWVAGAVAFITTGWLALKGKIAPSKLVRGFTVGLSTLGLGFTSTYVSSRIFSTRIRQDSNALDKEARFAVESELAVVLENRAHDTKQTPPLQSQASQAPSPQFQPSQADMGIPADSPMARIADIAAKNLQYWDAAKAVGLTQQSFYERHPELSNVAKEFDAIMAKEGLTNPAIEKFAAWKVPENKALEQEVGMTALKNSPNNPAFVEKLIQQTQEKASAQAEQRMNGLKKDMEQLKMRDPSYSAQAKAEKEAAQNAVRQPN